MKVLAAVAHADDIEFTMAGTLLLLQKAGCEIHLWNLCNGGCGTMTHPKEEIIRLRRDEAAEAARLIGAHYHEPLFDDLGIFYDRPSLAKVAAVVREVGPDLILTHPPADYMEDHEAVCRLITSAAFARGMPNFPTEPERPPVPNPVRLYHTVPHGLRDGMERPVTPQYYVEITQVLPTKRAMLACHRTQKEWLDASQGMDAYLDAMEALGAQIGEHSGRFRYAEGYLRHNHLGFCPAEYDPLPELLGAACARG